MSKEIQEAREIIQWFIDNDETNEGDEPMPQYGGESWNDINKFWIEGLNRARKFMEETKEF